MYGLECHIIVEVESGMYAFYYKIHAQVRVCWLRILLYFVCNVVFYTCLGMLHVMPVLAHSKIILRDEAIKLFSFLWNLSNNTCISFKLHVSYYYVPVCTRIVCTTHIELLVVATFWYRLYLLEKKASLKCFWVWIIISLTFSFIFYNNIYI